MDVDRLSGMKVDELKSYLRLRGLKVSGTKKKLVARAFVAFENNVPISMTAEQVQEEIKKSYHEKLLVDGLKIPDPFGITEGWLDEETGVKYWPMTFYPEIFNFLAFHPSELASKDLSDYKTCKAYSYYAQGWLSPLLFHNLDADSKFCLLKGTRRPSQRINDSPHKVWICVEKQTGNIKCTHCTCMAGMSQTCNHVAAALFRLEMASRMGLNNPACTSQACSWLPNTKPVEPMKVKDMKFGRSDFGKRGKKAKPDLNASPRKSFNPNTNGHKLTLVDVAAALRTVCSEDENIIFTAFPKERGTKEVARPRLPNSVDDSLLISNDGQMFLETVYQYKKEDLSIIESETRGQSENSNWFAYRKHVITASKAHSVKTKMASLRHKRKDVNLLDLFQTIAGNKTVNSEIPALQYGRAMEAEAVETFCTLYSQTHRNVTVMECGLYLCESMPYVGGSPDRIVSCSCCGKFCLEVKCPSSIRHTSPLDPHVELPYLKKVNGDITLNKRHMYYTQCQVQMAATGINKGYFFVWTAHGTFQEKLYFDEEFWAHSKLDFEEFYKNYYVPFLFN